MKRYTLLEMVKAVGASITADQISSLGESVEAEDIEMIVLEALEDITNRREWSWRQNQMRTGTATGSSTSRTTLLLPTDCDSLEQVRYRQDMTGATTQEYAELTYLYPEQFLELVRVRDTTNANVVTMNLPTVNVPIYVYKDRPPTYYTQFEHGAIVCDAYDEVVDPTGLSAGRSMMRVTINLDTSTAAGNATWVPNIPTKFFTLWVQEAKAAASSQLRQMQNARAEREARRTYIRLLALDEQVDKASEPREVNYGRQYRHG
jgi:hypothetical protein